MLYHDLVIKVTHKVVIGTLNRLEAILGIFLRHAMISIILPLVWVELKSHLAVCKLDGTRVSIRWNPCLS